LVNIKFDEVIRRTKSVPFFGGGGKGTQYVLAFTIKRPFSVNLHESDGRTPGIEFGAF